MITIRRSAPAVRSSHFGRSRPLFSLPVCPLMRSVCSLHDDPLTAARARPCGSGDANVAADGDCLVRERVATVAYKIPPPRRGLPYRKQICSTRRGLTTVATSPDGRQIASSSADGTVRSWVASGLVPPGLRPPGPPPAAAGSRQRLHRSGGGGRREAGGPGLPGRQPQRPTGPAPGAWPGVRRPVGLGQAALALMLPPHQR